MSGDNGNDGNNGDQTGGEHAGGNGQDGPNGGAGNGDDDGTDGTDQSTDQATGTGQDGDDNGTGADGESVDDKLARTTKHMRTWQTRAGENKTRAEKAEQERDEQAKTLAAVRKAFGLDQDEADPNKVAEQAQQTVAERDRELRAMRVERAAEKAARKAGADVDRLTDSRAFATAAAKLDPADDGFGDAMTALVEKHLDEHPHLRAKSDDPPPPSNEDMRNGGEGAGAGGSGSDDDDLDALSRQYAERN